MPIDTQLAWEESAKGSPPLTYDLEVSTSQDFLNLLVSESGLSSLIYPLEGSLNYETAYFWRARGRNNSGISDWSAGYSFTTTEYISPPQLISPENAASGVPTTAPAAGTPPFAYTIEIARDSAFKDVAKSVSNITTTQAEITGLPDGINLFWRV